MAKVGDTIKVEVQPVQPTDPPFLAIAKSPEGVSYKWAQVNWPNKTKPPAGSTWKVVLGTFQKAGGGAPELVVERCLHEVGAPKAAAKTAPAKLAPAKTAPAKPTVPTSLPLSPLPTAGLAPAAGGQAQAALVIDGSFLFSVVSKRPGEQAVDSVLAALTAAIAHLEATFQRQVVGYWIDGSLRGYEEYVINNVTDPAEKENALTTAKDRSTKLARAMNGVHGTLPRLTFVEVGKMKPQSGFVDGFSRSAVWVQSGVDTAVVCKLIEVYMENKYRPVMLCTGDGDLAPALDTCRLLQGIMQIDHPVRLVTVGWAASDEFGKNNRLGFQPPIKLDEALPQHFAKHPKSSKLATHANAHAQAHAQAHAHAHSPTPKPHPAAASSSATAFVQNASPKPQAPAGPAHPAAAAAAPPPVPAAPAAPAPKPKLPTGFVSRLEDILVLYVKGPQRIPAPKLPSLAALLVFPITNGLLFCGFTGPAEAAEAEAALRLVPAYAACDFKRMKQRIGYAVQTPLANAELFDLLLAPRTIRHVAGSQVLYMVPTEAELRVIEAELRQPGASPGFFQTTAFLCLANAIVSRRILPSGPQPGVGPSAAHGTGPSGMASEDTDPQAQPEAEGDDLGDCTLALLVLQHRSPTLDVMGILNKRADEFLVFVMEREDRYRAYPTAPGDQQEAIARQAVQDFFAPL